MDGFEVYSANDDKCIGHVAGQVGDFLIVEHGHLRKSCNPLPMSFAEIDEGNQRVVTTLAHDIVYDAPQVTKGQFDELEAKRYYGLADNPATEGYGDYDEHELKAGTDSDAAAERAEIRSELSNGTGEEDRAGAPAEQAPALLGDREPRSTD